MTARAACRVGVLGITGMLAMSGAWASATAVSGGPVADRTGLAAPGLLALNGDQHNIGAEACGNGNHDSSTKNFDAGSSEGPTAMVCNQAGGPFYIGPALANASFAIGPTTVGGTPGVNSALSSGPLQAVQGVAGV